MLTGLKRNDQVLKAKACPNKYAISMLNVGHILRSDLVVTNLFKYSLPGTVQLNLNLTEHVCSKGLTQHVFHFTCTQACVCMQH